MKKFSIQASLLIVFFISFIFVGAFVSRIARGADCRAFFYKRAVVQQQVAYVAPVYYSQPYYTPLAYYAAGADLQAEAQTEKIARQLAPKLLAELRAQLQAPLKQQVKTPIARPLPQPELPTHPISILATRCAKCHSGAAPKKGITIDGKTAMFCDQITASIRMIRDDLMPKDGPPLTPDEKGQALEELLALERMSSAQAPPIPQPLEENEITPQPEVIRPSQNPRPRDPRDDGNLQ